jgi:leucyl aminopeptidase
MFSIQSGRKTPARKPRAPEKGVSSTSRTIELLPPSVRPDITHSRGGEVDALLAVMAESEGPGVLAKLPEAERWRDLFERAPPRAGTVRTTTLANRGQTLAVLGFVRPQASAFERLALAGKMLKETAPRMPESIGLIAPGATSAASIEPMLAAALMQASATPAWKAGVQAERRIRRIQIPAGAPFDWHHAAISAEGTQLARWLTALPPNILDSRAYREAITRLAHHHGLEMSWLGERALRRAGANAFLAIAAGNAEPTAGIAHLKYRPGRHRHSPPDVALIGKGILFDTGGVNLKSHSSMLEMHTDMSGSAVALATLVALARLGSPLAADAWLAITENHVGPRAYRPQEIVRAANGVTIQVIHTDAEGRMVLADTLALAARTKPRLMLDFGTLTGVCIYALTERMSGVFTNRPELTPKLVQAGRQSGERVWSFPLDPDFDADLESKVADIRQCGSDAKGDHILAARFLSHFVPEQIPWVHVDLSSALRSGGLGHVNTDVTGFGVRYALELILKQEILQALSAAGTGCD